MKALAALPLNLQYRALVARELEAAPDVSVADAEERALTALSTLRGSLTKAERKQLSPTSGSREGYLMQAVEAAAALGLQGDGLRGHVESRRAQLYTQLSSALARATDVSRASAGVRVVGVALRAALRGGFFASAGAWFDDLLWKSRTLGPKSKTVLGMSGRALLACGEVVPLCLLAWIRAVFFVSEQIDLQLRGDKARPGVTPAKLEGIRRRLATATVLEKEMMIGALKVSLGVDTGDRSHVLNLIRALEAERQEPDCPERKQAERIFGVLEQIDASSWGIARTRTQLEALLPSDRDIAHQLLPEILQLQAMGSGRIRATIEQLQLAISDRGIAGIRAGLVVARQAGFQEKRQLNREDIERLVQEPLAALSQEEREAAREALCTDLYRYETRTDCFLKRPNAFDASAQAALESCLRPRGATVAEWMS